MTLRSAQAKDFGPPPVLQPLGYPGRSPDHSGLLLPDRMLPLLPRRGLRLSRWRVALDGTQRPGDTRRPGLVPLNHVLLRHNQSPLTQRYPLLAIGSNASPAQLWAKFSDHPARQILLLPITLAAEVRGLAAGLSAHISKHGYVPFTPVPARNVTSKLFLLWPDAAQLTVIDESEPNYHRVRIDHTDVSIILPSGERLPHCYAYISRHGHLIDERGSPILMPDAVSSRAMDGSQEHVLRTLLGRDGRLARTLGPDPEALIENVRRDPGLREEARRFFHQLGWVRKTQLETELISASGGTPENPARPPATIYRSTLPADEL